MTKEQIEQAAINYSNSIDFTDDKNLSKKGQLRVKQWAKQAFIAGANWIKAMTKNQETEYLKCVNSPYYFMTKYFQVEGEPFTTHLTEKQFNQFFRLRQWLYEPRSSNQFINSIQFNETNRSSKSKPANSPEEKES